MLFCKSYAVTEIVQMFCKAWRSIQLIEVLFPINICMIFNSNSNSFRHVSQITFLSNSLLQILHFSQNNFD